MDRWRHLQSLIARRAKRRKIHLLRCSAEKRKNSVIWEMKLHSASDLLVMLEIMKSGWKRRSKVLKLRKLRLKGLRWRILRVNRKTIWSKPSYRLAITVRSSNSIFLELIGKKRNAPDDEHDHQDDVSSRADDQLLWVVGLPVQLIY